MARRVRSLTRVVLMVVVAVLSFLLVTQPAKACTAFLQGDLIAGKNYDWNLDHGLLIVNKKGIAKRALLLNPLEKAAEWLSKYGSVTFNQYGREMPNGGMNEVGLVIETLMLPNTQNPAPDDRPAVTAWVQYQLDNSGTVEEVIASDKAIRISQAMPMPIHFFVADAQGQAAVVEFIEGRMVAHAGEQLPHKLITNDTCESSLAFLAEHKGFGGTKEILKGSHGSLDRFAATADRLKTYRPDGSRQAAIQYAFDTLAAVRQGKATKWSIVHDVKNLEIHYKTERCDQVRTVRLKDLDFNPKTPVRMVSINTLHTGVLTPHFMDYDADLNSWLIYYCVKRTPMLSLIPDMMLDLLARYPETTVAE
ncbi:MAG TPA: linear amide C-N hydrolase [Sedimentisphaerales bacterium]|nr:linear amide C-N hydrolase [Sedimentisphaerales bacterium]